MSSLLYNDDWDAQEPVIKLNVVSPYKARCLKIFCSVLIASSPRDHKLLRDRLGQTH